LAWFAMRGWAAKLFHRKTAFSSPEYGKELGEELVGEGSLVTGDSDQGLCDEGHMHKPSVDGPPVVPWQSGA
jgi:hypothetical protein